MRSAVFVDAGYLYAEGSKALAGHRLRRDAVELNLSETIAKIRGASAKRSDGATLLRIYWYDGLLRGRQSQDQSNLAYAEDVKLRLGIVNEAGQQKGVDSLIVTDLVELARNHAITDALLLSGDEDLRIGVQIAQSFGVRVHLIGIEPSRGSQSDALLQEADTTTEWSEDEVCTLLTLKPGFEDTTGASGDAASAGSSNDVATILKQAVAGFVSSLAPEDIATIDGLEEVGAIPPQYDRRLLATCRAEMGRDLTQDERSRMRVALRQAVKAEVGNL